MMVSSYPLSLFLTCPFFLPLFGKALPKATLSRRDNDQVSPSRLYPSRLLSALSLSQAGSSIGKARNLVTSALYLGTTREMSSSPSFLFIAELIGNNGGREGERERETSLITKMCLSWNPNKFSFKKLSMWFPWQEAEFTWRAHVLNDGDIFVLYLRRVLEARLEC